MMTDSDVLARTMAQQNLVCVDTTLATTFGFVEWWSDELVLVRRYVRLHRSGFRVVCRHAVEDIWSDVPALNFRKAMLPPSIDATELGRVDTLVDVLDWFGAANELVIVRGSKADSGDDYVAGAIVAVQKSSVIVKQMTPWGEWSGHVAVSLEDIDHIEFGTDYLVALRKYGAA
jgi:hypothetical protein